MSDLIPFDFENKKVRLIKKDDEWKGGKRIDTLGGPQEMVIISETFTNTPSQNILSVGQK